MIPHPTTPEKLKLQRGFSCEAIDAGGIELWTRVAYNHSTRGTWTAYLFNRDTDTIVRLDRAPRLSSARWRNGLTSIGAAIAFEGRQ